MRSRVVCSVVSEVEVLSQLGERAADWAGREANFVENWAEKEADWAEKEALDKIATVEVDKDTEDEYWDLGSLPFFGPLRLLRKRTSNSEVALVGLVAGGAVELARALLLHPLDTAKTRLQASPRVDDRDVLHMERILDGLGPAVASVPLCAVFWAVKDVVRRNILSLALPFIPVTLWRDVLSQAVSAAVGEAAYWAARTPSELVKTQQQAEAVLDDEPPQKQAEDEAAESAAEPLSAAAGSAGAQEGPPEDEALDEAVAKVEETSAEAAADAPSPRSPTGEDPPLWDLALRAYPVLALSDVPNVALRTGFFVLLHSAPDAPTGVGADTLLFAIAATGAALLSTPLDVARTRLLLSGGGAAELPGTLRALAAEGPEGLMAGWLPRVLWNGVAVGAVIGLVRQEYAEVRARFLLDVLDKLEALSVPTWAARHPL